MKGNKIEVFNDIYVQEYNKWIYDMLAYDYVILYVLVISCLGE
jgi:hypothetical protein